MIEMSRAAPCVPVKQGNRALFNILQHSRDAPAMEGPQASAPVEAPRQVIPSPQGEQCHCRGNPLLVLHLCLKEKVDVSGVFP